MQGSALWRPGPRGNTIEHRIASWIAERKPRGRVMACGGLRFRLNVWYDVAQIGGGFESGLRNRMPHDVTYHARTGKHMTPEQQRTLAVLELKSLGIEYVAAHGKGSREYYRDFNNAALLGALGEPVFRTEDDAVYALPFRSLAHLVAPAEVMKPGRPPGMEAYVRAIEDAARAALKTEWRGPKVLAVEGPVPEGMLVSVQVNGDPGWRAVQDGAAIPIESDGMGFVVLRPRPAALARIEMRYEGTGEQRAMAALSVLAWIGGLGALARRRRDRARAAAV